MNQIKNFGQSSTQLLIDKIWKLIYNQNVKYFHMNEGGIMLEWGRILDEYSDSRNAIRNYSEKQRRYAEQKGLKDSRELKRDSESEIVRDMYSELNDNINEVKRIYHNELSLFLMKEESSILTQRQHAVMTMRAKGMTMEEIALKLNVSRTAIFKSVKLSEKKIRKMYD